MLGRLKHRGLHLRTTLVITYFIVALVAVIAAVLVALPLLQTYQEEQVAESHKRAVLDYSRNLDNLRGMIQTSANPKPAVNPFRDYYATNQTPGAVKPVLTWSAPPPIETVRQLFSNLATSQGRRLIILTDRDHEVKVDTETDPNLSLEGEVLPDVRLTPNQPSGSLPYEANITTVQGRQMTLIYRAVSGANAPNLFGLNGQQSAPLPYILAMYVPVEQPRAVWGDLTLILVLPVLAALAVSLLAGFLLARNLSRPLVRLTQATHAVARGDYEQEVLPEGSYEVHQLAQSFNQMTRDVAESQRMQRQLIANVSHELKTPLTSIQGFSQAMLDGALHRPEDFARPAEIISNESARMIRLVNSLLDLSKLESGQAALHRRDLDLTTLLENCLDGFQPRAEAAGVELVGSFAPTLWLNADPDRLRQVFNNLIDNALKYTPVGGRIEVKSSQAGSDALITVSDTGAGIPTADLPHIFERFYQSDKSRRRDLASEGIGLGLAITKEIVLAHGGRIEASSRPARGTTFQVVLPLPAPAPSQETNSTRPAPPAGELAQKPV